MAAKLLYTVDDLLGFAVTLADSFASGRRCEKAGCAILYCVAQSVHTAWSNSSIESSNGIMAPWVSFQDHDTTVGISEVS